MQPRIAVDATHIGQILYPVDNSNVFNITDNKIDDHVKLAGHNSGDGKLAVPVKIVSGEYIRVITDRWGTYALPCVTVEYEGKLYIVYNVFTQQPDPIEKEYDDSRTKS